MVIEEHNEFVEDNVSENEVEDSAEDEDIEAFDDLLAWIDFAPARTRSPPKI